MNFFRRLFFKPEKQEEYYEKQEEYNFKEFVQPAVRSKRHPENAQGDFYVVNEECMMCGAPEVEGQGLIEHSKKDEYGSCFFKKQPETDEEIEHAISAVQVSCISALRYGGKEENILRKMYELGLADQCDYLPNGHYRLTIRNVVCFYCEENITAIAKTITQALAKNTWYKVLDFVCDKTSHFSFTIQQKYQYIGNFVKGEALQNGFYTITITNEAGALTFTVMHTAEDLHTLLVDVLHASNIQWYEGKVAGDGAPRPTYV